MSLVYDWNLSPLKRTRGIKMNRILEILKEQKSRKKGILAGEALLTFYLAFVLISQNSSAIGTPQPPVIKAGIILCSAAAVLFGVHKMSGRVMVCNGAQEKLSLKTFVIVSAATMAVLAVWLLGYWPGGYSVDSVWQWQQAHNGHYNDWHPVLHTLLTFTLPLKLIDAPAFPVILQCIYFALSLAYLTCVLKRFGCPKWLYVLMNLYIFVCPVTGEILMYPMKDAALSILTLLLLAQVVSAVMTRGAWLDRPLNMAAMVLVMGIATITRHNAVLYIFPTIIVLGILYRDKWKRLLFMAAGVLVIVALVRGGLYRMLHVEDPGQRQAEVLGLPMTILASVYDKEPQSVSPEAAAFMERIAPWEDWHEYYETGKFLSVKFKFNANPKIEEEGTANILKYTAQAVLAEPEVSWRAFIKLTDSVWATEGEVTWNMDIDVTDNEEGIYGGGIGAVKRELNNYTLVTMNTALKYLFWYTGALLLLLLFASVASMSRIGWKGVLIILPLLLYDYGTMMLLPGEQFRYFHITFLYLFPMLFLLFARQKNGKSDRDVLETEL